MPFNDKLDLKSIEIMDEAYYEFKKIVMSFEFYKNKLPQRSLDFLCNFLISFFKYLRFGVWSYLSIYFPIQFV